MKPKILFFSNLYPLPWEPTRGQFNYQQTLSLEKDADISYLIPVAFATWFKQVLFKNQFSKKSNCCYFPYFYPPGFAYSLHPLFMLLSIIVSIKPLIWFAKHPNVIASWAYQEGVAASMLKRLFNFKLTIDCLGSDVNVHSEHPKRASQLRRAFHRADTVATKSKALANIVSEIAPNANVVTIYNGVNFERFKVQEKPLNQPFKLLFIGNLIKTKGVYELVAAASLLKKQKIDFELAIIGKGPEYDNLKKEIASQTLQEHVKLVGALPHEALPQWLAESHALILPSYREGVPNVIMEALASGTPVVATSVGGIPEVVTPMKNGVLLTDYQPQTICNGILSCHQASWAVKEINQSVSAYTWQNTSQGFLKTFI